MILAFLVIWLQSYSAFTVFAYFLVNFFFFYSSDIGLNCRIHIIAMPPYITDNEIKALVATFDVIATLVVNVPLLIVLATSKRLKKDVTSRSILPLTISDIGLGALYPIISAVVAWGGPGVTHASGLFEIQTIIFTTFSLASIWHLALVSIVKCQIIIDPLTIFTER